MFTVRPTEAFVAWLDDLKTKQAQVRIAARLRQAEAGSLGDWQPVEGEVCGCASGLATGCISFAASGHRRDAERG